MNKILEINELIKNDELYNFTKKKLLLIKNKKIVSSIYYRDRGKINVDEIFNLYNNEDLIISIIFILIIII